MSEVEEKEKARERVTRQAGGRTGKKERRKRDVISRQPSKEEDRIVGGEETEGEGEEKSK